MGICLTVLNKTCSCKLDFGSRGAPPFKGGAPEPQTSPKRAPKNVYTYTRIWQFLVSGGTARLQSGSSTHLVGEVALPPVKRGALCSKGEEEESCRQGEWALSNKGCIIVGATQQGHM